VAATSSFWGTFRQSRIPMALLDRDAVYVDVNGAACRAGGREREDIIGQPLGFSMRPEHRAQFHADWSSLLQRGRLVIPWEFELGGRTIKTDVVCVADTPEAGVHLVVFGPPAPVGTSNAVLSPREVEITQLLAVGLTGEQIAERLQLSPATVRTHIRNAMTALNAPTRSSLVARALRDGLIALGVVETLIA